MKGTSGGRERAVEEVVREAELPSGVDGLDAELARELMTHYLESAGGRIEEVRRAAAAARAQPGEAAALDRLRSVLHKIAGSAGTYGFPALTASARVLEKQALAARDAPPAPAALLDGVDAFEGEMVRAFASARAALGPAAPSAEPSPPAIDPAAVVAVAILGQRDAARGAEELLAAAGVRVVSAGADGAILVGGAAEALVEAGRFLCEGRPLVAVGSSGGTAAALAGRTFGAAQVGAADTAEDAAAELLSRLASRPR